MKIALITAGAGGMYCGSCLHDNTLAAAMLRMKHDVSLIPTYTPIRTDESDVSIGRVFYGAINVYLEQRSAVFRHTPWLLDRMLDRPGLLNWASRRGASVDPTDLGDLTLSVLQGEEGNQSKELDKLVSWLRDDLQPEIVQLTNSMFLGLAHRIRDEVGVPVLCALQGEDLFLDGLSEPWASRVRGTLVDRARFADGFISMSNYYADAMAGLLQVPRERIHVVPLGLQLEGHGRVKRHKTERPFTIGYLARICPEKGLHDLAEAFRQLADREGRDQVRLRIAGYLGERDKPYLDGVLEQLRHWGLDDVVDYVGEVDREQKIDFLGNLHVLSVPTVYREPKGLFALEALANSTPVVLPRHGAFPEMIGSTGGGILTEPGSIEELVDALRGLMHDQSRLERLGEEGRENVHRERGETIMAEQTLELYRSYLTRDAGKV